MATGRKAFGGASQASLISSIMSADPPSISAVQPLSPPALDRVIRKCLAKDPEDRWQSAHDVASELKWVGEGGSQAGIPAPVVSRRHSRERLAWLLAGTFAAAAIAAGAFALRRPETAVARREFLFTPPSDQDLDGIAISPDEKTIAVILEDPGGNSALFLRTANSVEMRRIAGTEGAVDPFWSPDGKHIGFFARGKLRRMAIEGGVAQSLTETDRFGASWNADGTILFSPAFGKPLFRIPAAGGALQPVSALDATRQEVTHYWPQFLPDGKHFLFYARCADPAKSAIWAGSLNSRERQLVTTSDAGPIYVEPGWLLFAREGALLAQRFDPGSRTLSGDAFPLARKVAIDPATNKLGAAATRSLLVYEAHGPRNRQLTWMDREGRVVGTIGQPAEYWGYAFSTDGKRIAVTIADPESRSGDIWILDPSRGTRTRLTSGPTDEFAPHWSPDGYVYYSSDREGFYNVYRIPAGGGGAEETIYKDGTDKWVDDVSRDGTQLLYSGFDVTTGFDAWTMPARAGSRPAEFVRTRKLEGAGRFSPDGRWIAYVARDAGREDVFIAPRSGATGREQVSLDGGTDPRWSASREEIFFVSPGKALMAATIRFVNGSAKPEPPRRLFEYKSFRWTWGTRSQSSYEVGPDGNFLVSVPAEEPGRGRSSLYSTGPRVSRNEAEI